MHTSYSDANKGKAIAYLFKWLVTDGQSIGIVSSVRATSHQRPGARAFQRQAHQGWRLNRPQLDWKPVAIRRRGLSGPRRSFSIGAVRAACGTGRPVAGVGGGRRADLLDDDDGAAHSCGRRRGMDCGEAPPMISMARSAASTSSPSVFCASSLPPTRTNARHSSASTGRGAQSTCDGHVERFAQARIMPGFLGPPGHDLDSFQAELGAGVDQERGLGLVGFDQGQLQLRSDDLEREAGQASARADIDHFPCVPEVVNENEAVLDQPRRRRRRHETRPLGDHSCELRA